MAGLILEDPPAYQPTTKRLYVSSDGPRVEDVANAPTVEDLLTDRLISTADHRRLSNLLTRLKGAWLQAWESIQDREPSEDPHRIGVYMGRIIDSADEARRIVDGVRPVDPRAADPVTLGDIALTRETAGKVLRNWLQRDARASSGGEWTAADLEYLGGTIRLLQIQQAEIRAYRAQSNGQAA